MSLEKKYKFGFFGAGELALSTLDILVYRHGLFPSVIVTKPDKPARRGMKIEFSPLKKWALSKNIPVYQPEKLTGGDVKKTLSSYNCDIFVVVSYGKIIPKDILGLPPHKTVNIHPSLLPKYRGPSPMQSAILSSDKETGVTLMLLDEEMDHGPVITQTKFPLDPLKETFTHVMAISAIDAAELIAEKLPAFVEGKLKATPQNHDKATYTKKIEKENGEIFLDDNPHKNILKYNAYHSWPGIYFFHNKNGKVIRVSVTEATYENDSFILKKLKPEGRNEMSFDEFIRGYGDPYKTD